MTQEDDSTSGLKKTHLIRELVDLSKFTDGILRTMGSAVVAVDGDERIIYVNPAAEKLLGLKGPSLGARSAREVLVTRGGGSLIAFGLENADAVGEVDLMRADGTHVTVEARITPLLEEGGGFVAILSDLTEVKRAQEQARRKEQLASLGELSAGVAHEIRNPLAGISTSGELLKNRVGHDPRALPLVEVILEETARLNRIVENLLEFARPVEPAMQHIQIVDCAAKVLEWIAERAARQKVRVVEDLGAVPKIWADPDLLYQVFLNVVQNALDAMKDGGTLTVAVTAERHPRHVRRSRGRRKEDRILPPEPSSDPLDWVQVMVRDTGTGMTKETQDRAFDPFYTTRSHGTGLGLSISQSIIQQHMGMLWIESEPDHGTTVRVELPVDRRQRSRRSH